MYSNSFFSALSITNDAELKYFSKISNITTKKLKYYPKYNLYPDVTDRDCIIKTLDISELELKIKLGYFDKELLDILSKNAKTIVDFISPDYNTAPIALRHKHIFKTEYGNMYQGDCISLMDKLEKNSVDLIFADPPFNLDKKYESGMNDKIEEEEYIKWTETWVLKCIDLLKEGGSFFIWNLPKWNTHISSILNKHLNFKHWIAVDIKYRLPIKNRLYPSHYGLLYYTKGEKGYTFNEQRLPLEICRHCGGDIRDYGGYKDQLNPSGINLTDVWFDIPPVRHSKYKTRDSNELSMKLLERIISLSTNENDVVFDPFGGSGTTYVVSEILKRKWIGVEIGDVENIKNRFDSLEFQKEYINNVQNNKNKLFTEEMRKLRTKNGQWLPETLVKKRSKNKANK
ncbi:site-specific DNA-methyltransferase [Paenibacillus sp. UNC499MF]|uniref:DNA-methyltransferase n=1 Tax=Paenibacillus sp. UNC499MF TaxID=1502751 RepID=UPI0008A0668A|nr:site-specific DNA-methyltransferase [Paenibacillus sp. UNC499MF]SEG75799.1 site-specific DNA-methyltransferase (adenine-specific) [Paenibacillus sp. UNC499MF]